MIVLKWVFPVSLAVLAIVHLVSCWRGDDDLRKPTKIALMPVVALAYLAFARMPSLWVVAGLLFGCLGDLFLLWPLKKKFFALGTSSFFLGHVCYLIFIYTHYVIRISWIWIVVVCVIYAAGAAFVYANSRRNIPRALRPLALTYMLMLCVLSVSLILPLLTALVYAPLYLLRTSDWRGTIALALIFPAMLWAHRSNFARWREGKEQTFRQFLFGRHEPQREEAGE